jgi:hypothetical protein
MWFKVKKKALLSMEFDPKRDGRETDKEHDEPEVKGVTKRSPFYGTVSFK